MTKWDYGEKLSVSVNVLHPSIHTMATQWVLDTFFFNPRVRSLLPYRVASLGVNVNASEVGEF